MTQVPEVTAPEGFEEFQRFSNCINGELHRTIVYKSDASIYRITKLQYIDGEWIVSENIHGNMSTEAILAWMTNAFFNACYGNSDRSDRAWMMGDVHS